METDWKGSPMLKSLRVAAAGVMLAALGGAGVVAASPASAASTYSVLIYQQGFLVANFCLHAQSYDNHNDHRWECSGDKGIDRQFRLSIPVTDRHRAWLDVWVRAGANGEQITLHNGYHVGLKKHVFNTRQCILRGTTFDWDLYCDGENFYET